MTEVKWKKGDLKAAQSADALDAARYRWLTEDHADYTTRMRVEAIAVAMNIRGKGHTDAAIDAACAAMGTPPAAVPDSVWEALQRLIENAAVMGPGSRDDVLAVARWRGQFVAAREATPPAQSADALDAQLPEPDIVVTDAGDAWKYATNKEVKGEYFYSAKQMRAAMGTKPSTKEQP